MSAGLHNGAIAETAGETRIGLLGSWTLDLRTGRVRLADGTEELFGLPPGQVDCTYDELMALAHPDDRTRAALVPGEAIGRGGRCEGAFRVVWPDGSVHKIFGRGRLHRDADGKPARLVVLAAEITEFSRAELALRASEAEFREAFELAGVGKVQVDAHTGRFLRVNRKQCEITGYAEDELLRLNFLDITHPDDRAQDVEQFRRLVAGAINAESIEKRYVRKDGSTVWVHVTASLIRDADGRPLRTAGVIEDIGERRRAEEALRDSEQRYRDLFENANDIIYTVDLDGRITSLNRRGEQTFGYRREELLGRSAAELVPPEYLPLMVKKLQEKMAGGESPTVYELEIFTKDGKRVPVEISSRLIVRDGAPVGVQGIARDISERKAAERALREKEERFHKLADNLPSGFIYQITQDPQGGLHFSYVSAGVENLCGLKPEEALADPTAMYRLIHPEDLPRMQAREMESFRTGNPFDCQFRQRVRGEVRWLHCRSARRPLDNGWAIWDGIAVDITSRKTAAEQVRLSEERLRLALDAGKIGAWDWDIASNTVTWSERVYEFHGLTRTAFGGHVDDFTRLVHPDDADRVNEAIRRAVEEHQPYSLEFRIVRPDGEVRWIGTNGRVLYADDGRPVRMIGATIDLTDRHAAEDALREADRRKDDFLAMLAHELRNPLAPIRNAVQVLKLVGPPEPRVEQVRGMIERQVAHLARLVDDLLDVSRISRGKVLLRRERLDLVPVVRGTVDDLRPLLETTGLTVHAELDSGPLWLDGDTTRLAQAVGNLLQNANKFTDAGGSVFIRLAAEGDTAVFSVRDTGIGMDSAILDRLFEPFSQADRSLDRSRGGLGLGLALVKGLAELHGGSVAAASPGPGAGSEFTLRLPLCQVGAAAEPSDEERAVGGKALRVLIIEDHRDAAESLRMLLNLCGHHVAMAHTGMAGLDAARSCRPDVVLCDIGLPGGMDGYMIARAFRADPELFGVALIALSGYGQEEDQRRARQAGFDRHLTKPVDPATLEELLARM